MAGKKIEFNAKNVKPFQAWLKKFSMIDTALLLEVDGINNEFIAKTYNEEHSVVKLSKIKFDAAGFTIKSKSLPDLIKVGIYNISRLMKIMDQFKDDDFVFTVNYEELIGQTTEEVGSNLILKNKNLKINVDCTSLNIFKYVTEKLFKEVIAAIEKKDVLAEFPLTKENIEKTNSLCSLDNESDYMEFKKKNGVFVAGDSFELLLDVESVTSNVDEESSITIFKDQYEAVDIDDYDALMGTEKIVFTSDDLNTIIVISMVEKD